MKPMCERYRRFMKTINENDFQYIFVITIKKRRLCQIKVRCNIHLEKYKFIHNKLIDD